MNKFIVTLFSKKKARKSLTGLEISFAKTALVLCGLLLGVQFVFLNIQTQIAASSEAAIVSFFGGSDTVSNPYYLSQMIAGLEKSHFIGCVELKKQNQDIHFYKSAHQECLVSKRADIFLLGQYRSLNLKAVNGEGWTIKFRSVNGSLFFISLWFLRGAVFIIFSMALIWHQTRVRNAQQIEKIKTKIAEDFSLFASQVSHDIRSPLAALNMIIDLPPKKWTRNSTC